MVVLVFWDMKLSNKAPRCVIILRVMYADYDRLCMSNKKRAVNIEMNSY